VRKDSAAREALPQIDKLCSSKPASFAIEIAIEMGATGEYFDKDFDPDPDPDPDPDFDFDLGRTRCFCTPVT